MGYVTLSYKGLATVTEQEFWAILQAMPEPKPIFYRLYYNDNGDPVVYTMQDLPGKYIDIDHETYALSSYDVKVVDGKLVKIIPKIYTRKLVPGTGTACAPKDITVVVDQTHPHTKWSIKQNETN
jgi:hypothetical protein